MAGGTIQEYIIKEVSEDNICDLIEVCTPKKIGLAFIIGMRIMEDWARSIISKYGVVGEVAYNGEEPVAALVHFPAWEDPLMRDLKGVMYLQCLYNPNPVHHGKGVGSSLVKATIKHARESGLYEYVITHAFETNEYVSQRRFLTAFGFRRIPDSSEEDLYYPLGDAEWVHGVPRTFWKGAFADYIPKERHVGKAVIYYTPTCQYGYVLAERAREVINEIDPSYPVTLINYWERPNEYISDGGHWLIVNAHPIDTLSIKREEFRREVLKAMQYRASRPSS